MHPPPPVLPAGSVAPSIVLQTVDGTRFSALPPPVAHALVLDFFQGMCSTCQQKADTLCSLANTFPKLTVAAIDSGGESTASVKAFAQRFFSRCSITVLLDPGLRVTRNYQVSVVPTVYVVDMSGKIAYGDVGASGIDGLAAALRGLRGAA